MKRLYDAVSAADLLRWCSGESTQMFWFVKNLLSTEDR